VTKASSEVQTSISSDRFGKFAASSSAWLGSKWAFLGAGLVILVWGATGPVFHFSDTWQLVINTGTTIVTFLMVFLIQNTQNRDARAINLKLNELIHAIGKARNQMIDIEKLTDIELDELQARYEKIKRDTGKHQVDAPRSKQRSDGVSDDL
jgi:low affinity Fe/Cu permease